MSKKKNLTVSEVHVAAKNLREAMAADNPRQRIHECLEELSLADVRAVLKQQNGPGQLGSLNVGELAHYIAGRSKGLPQRSAVDLAAQSITTLRVLTVDGQREPLDRFILDLLTAGQKTSAWKAELDNEGLQRICADKKNKTAMLRVLGSIINLKDPENRKFALHRWATGVLPRAYATNRSASMESDIAAESLKLVDRLENTARPAELNALVQVWKLALTEGHRQVPGNPETDRGGSGQDTEAQPRQPSAVSARLRILLDDITKLETESAKAHDELATSKQRLQSLETSVSTLKEEHHNLDSELRNHRRIANETETRLKNDLERERMRAERAETEGAQSAKEVQILGNQLKSTSTQVSTDTTEAFAEKLLSPAMNLKDHMARIAAANDDPSIRQLRIAMDSLFRPLARLLDAPQLTDKNSKNQENSAQDGIKE